MKLFAPDRKIHAVTALALCLALGIAAACGAPPERPTDRQMELKVTVPAARIGAVLTAWKLEARHAERASIWFFDTPDLQLFGAGLILRARSVHGDDDDTTVKFRPLAQEQVAARWRELPGFKCESDRSGATSPAATTIVSCSLTAQRSGADIDAATRAGRGCEALFTRNQRDFAAEYSPVAPAWNRLRALGPVTAREWDLRLPGFGPELSAELWTLPDGTELLELSTRVEERAADATAAELGAALRDHGIPTDAQPVLKTRLALERLARH